MSLTIVAGEYTASVHDAWWRGNARGKSRWSAWLSLPGLNTQPPRRWNPHDLAIKYAVLDWANDTANDQYERRGSPPLHSFQSPTGSLPVSLIVRSTVTGIVSHSLQGSTVRNNAKRNASGSSAIPSFPVFFWPFGPPLILWKVLNRLENRRSLGGGESGVYGVHSTRTATLRPSFCHFRPFLDFTP